jgi:hypothetical protein
MWAPTDWLTLMGMVPFLSNTMDHVTRMSVQADPEAVAFSTGSSGLGDVALTALVTALRPERQRLIVGLGVSLPTGSITAADVTPASAPNEAQLPYPMQLGSGTVDLKPALTYLGQNPDWSWGAQANGVVRLGTNDQDYRLGHRVGGTAWGARRFSGALSASVRLAAETWGTIDGASPAYAGAVAGRMVPTVFPDLRGGTRLDALLGLNAEVPSGPLHGLRFATELGRPLFQTLDGPQLETDWVVTVGTQYAFDL